MLMRMLCYIFLLHQTTTARDPTIAAIGCVISFFYIKPQLVVLCESEFGVVLYLSSTSNHNLRSRTLLRNVGCVISFFYIKPQRCWQNKADPKGCVISFFYIKPQPI